MDEQNKQHTIVPSAGADASVTAHEKQVFVEPEVSAPVDVLEATEFFGGGSGTFGPD